MQRAIYIQLFYLLCFSSLALLAIKTNAFLIPVLCLAGGAMAGIAHCLKAVYLHKCYYKNWDDTWITWHLIRPIISGLKGLTVYTVVMALQHNEFAIIGVAITAGYLSTFPRRKPIKKKQRFSNRENEYFDE